MPALGCMLTLVMLGGALGLAVPVDEYAQEMETAYWRDVAKAELRAAIEEQRVTGVAKNVILFLGDGMGPTTVTAGRILNGQMKGKKGEEVKLSFDRFPFTGISRTYNVDTQTTDSAASGTAYLTGVKTRQGMLGLNGRAFRGNCSSAQGNEVTSILKWYKEAGRSAGIVTTTRVTHATPGAAYAHVPDRDWENDANVPHSGADVTFCKDIAAQLVEDNADINVIMGGGRQNFFPKGTPNHDASSSNEGSRLKGNLIEEWLSDKAYKGSDKPDTYRFVYDKDGLDSVDTSKTDYLLGLFSDSHMDFEQDRNKSKQPSLSEMTQAAIEILSKDEKGYFLLVEGGRIDHGHHEGRASAALHDLVAMADAVAVADSMTSKDDTLIVVTADHSHTMAISGYSKRGNPILGQANPWKRTEGTLSGDKIHSYTTDDMPYTTLLYANGPGFDHRANITGIDTEDKDYKQQSAVPMTSETHGGEDVFIFARGPQAFLYTGVHEQNFIPVAMAYAACVGDFADDLHNCARFSHSESIVG